MSCFDKTKQTKSDASKQIQKTATEIVNPAKKSIVLRTTIAQGKKNSVVPSTNNTALSLAPQGLAPKLASGAVFNIMVTLNELLLSLK
jgi:hypothetical protein